MVSPIEILQEHWGYPAFRPLQAEIVEAVIQGRDTLALLPTGGGKSICYQVPGLYFEGLTLVVSPLIALMQDQVAQLNRRHIPATFINSSLSFREIDRKLQAAMEGRYKFLYIAPERIETEMFLARLPKMNVQLIAIDEAHCISQWGYDFRPSYLKINKLRELLPKVPLVALTATAPESVRKDILEKLQLRNPAEFKQSFRRPNLQYIVESTEQVAQRILDICSAQKGTGIVYARTRKRVQAIADMLQKAGISAAAYHGGLKTDQRNKVQAAWIDNKVRIMAATNAFGMGIDKPDVRFVLHFNLPADIESYYQEAGRAGRDGEPALCIAFQNEQDFLELETFQADKYPDWPTLGQHWMALCEHFGVSNVSAPVEAFPFDLMQVVKELRLNPMKLYNSIKVLEAAGLVAFREDADDFGYLQVMVGHTEVLDYKARYPMMAQMLDHILRNLGGAAFQESMRFLPMNWERSLGLEPDALLQKLDQLQQRGIIEFTPPRSQPSLAILSHRRPLNKLEMQWDKQEFLRHRAKERLQAILEYASIPTKMCRARQLEAYFGESSGADCRQCDYCLEKYREGKGSSITEISTAILAHIGNLEMDLRDLVKNVAVGNPEQRTQVLREMLDRGILQSLGGTKVRRKQ